MKYLILLLMFLPSAAFAGGFQVTMNEQYTATATVTSAQILIPSQQRYYLLIQNLSTTVNVIVKFGSAQTGTEGIQIPPGGNYEVREGVTDSLWVRSASSTAPIVVFGGQ